MMGKVKNENFIVIQGFMINDLKLKGNELLVYATIYGFSQTDNQVFSGSLQYLADWTNSSKQGVQKNLKSLVDKGFIKKDDKFINGVKFCEYYVTKFNEVCNSVVQGMQQSCIGSMQQSCTNNIELDNINNNINDNKESKKEKKSNYDVIIDELINDEDVKEGIYEFIKMRKLIKKPLTDRALRQLISKLNTLSTNTKEQIQILDNSIINNWASVFPLKKDYSGSKRKEVIPSWMNKKPQLEQLSAEEQEALDKSFKEAFNPDLTDRVEELKKRLGQ